ncbi:hypothetical protein Q5O14_06745 [Eubacteriaceae bacterium ES2]|nr:hypothetical protein Q5O14_06745 [Eubacteriaceae bacterium ES2]
MFRKIKKTIPFFVLILVLSMSAVFAQTADYGDYNDESGNISIQGETVSDRDFLFAGSNINVNANFDTTTIFMGNIITLDGEYNGDVFVFGNTITINGKINGSLYTAGNVITVNGEVRDDVFVACSDFSLGNTAWLNRDVWFSGANGLFEGTVGRNLRSGSGNLILNGKIGGFVDASVDQLTINDTAEVQGAIDNKSENEAIVAAGASVPDINWEKVTTQESQIDRDQGTSVGSVILAIITKLAFILVIWLLITFIAKEFSENTSLIVKKHLWPSLGIGAGYMFLSPIILLISFIIYVPFGLAMMFLIIASFILAMPIAAVVFSKLLIKYFENQMKPLLASFVSVIIIAAAIILIGYIPFLGGLTGFALILFGTGFLGYNILFGSRQLKEEKSILHDDDHEESLVMTIEEADIVEQIDHVDEVEPASEPEEDENN